MSKDDGNFCSQDGQDLKELFNSQIENIRTLINANDKNYNQRFDNIIQTIKDGLDAANRANTIALASSDRANTKAELATEKRFDAVNEFRRTQDDRDRAEKDRWARIETTLMPRGEVEILIKAMNEKIDNLSNNYISQKSGSTGQKEGMMTIALIAGVISTFLVIVSRFIK